MKYFFTGSFLLCCICLHAQQTNNLQEQMTALFNGENLNGWHSFLVTKGVNNDPQKVFKIEDGLLHISGQEFGYLMTEKSYKNFHIVAEFKWGKKKWPPRDADTTRRDNGICYYVPVTAKDTVWPKSVECQIQEGDVGDMWLIGHASAIMDGKRTDTVEYYNKVPKKIDNEHKTGKWNRVEVIANNGHITYIVNGKVVNEASEPSMTEGRILVQSEGAEIFYRKIEIAEL